MSKTQNQIPHLNPASVTRRAPWQDGPELRISNWMTPWDQEERIDAGFIGAPYSAASISPSGAAGGPEAVRMAFRYNTTYSPDWETDVRDLVVRDLGDIAGHLTSVTEAHQHIEDAMAAALTRGNLFVPLLVGGDHSVTAPAVRGFCKAHAGKKVGIINIDAHMDVRILDSGPHNGTPFRQIVEGLDQVDGRNVVELGIHGFMNAEAYHTWCTEQGITVISGRQIQKRGMDECIAESLQRAGDGTDAIYLSVDIDCLAYPFTIGTSAASPEGLSAWQLLEAVFAAGKDPKVQAFDVVEIDPSRDVKDLTARSGCSVILAFLAGLRQRQLAG
ncbi:MAG: agmatinase family protein [Thermomicrobiales bacterium]|nr:agmatinase family protein [Thermomicrobiales bacterium]